MALLDVAAYFYNNVNGCAAITSILLKDSPSPAVPSRERARNYQRSYGAVGYALGPNRWQKLLSGFGLYTSAATSTLTGLFTSSRTNCASTLRVVGPS